MTASVLVTEGELGSNTLLNGKRRPKEGDFKIIRLARKKKKRKLINFSPLRNLGQLRRLERNYPSIRIFGLKTLVSFVCRGYLIEKIINQINY